MKKILSKIIGSSVIASLLIVPMLSVNAQGGERREIRVENRSERIENRIERPLLKASTTEKRLENRENNIERIRARIASTTASTSAKRMENLDKRLEKQQEQMSKAKERLLEKELKVADVLGKISEKIQERINILADKGLDMAVAKTKLAEAAAKIEDMTAESANLATLIGAEITASSSAQLFIDVKASQDKIRDLAFTTHALLVDTIKEINKVLPAKPVKSATTTATSTN